LWLISVKSTQGLIELEEEDDGVGVRRLFLELFVASTASVVKTRTNRLDLVLIEFDLRILLIKIRIRLFNHFVPCGASLASSFLFIFHSIMFK
jgi:hypothetical protein